MGDTEGSDVDMRSDRFKRHFLKGNVSHHGWVNRYRGKPNGEVLNKSLVRFCEERNEALPTSHRMFIRNPEAEFISAAKYDKSQPVLNEKAWKISGDWTIRHFGPHMSASKVVSENIAVQEADRTPSAGYPWNLEYKSKGEFFDSPARSFLDEYWAMIARVQDQEYKPIWSCCEKIELRALEKIESNSVRTFTCSPVEHGIALNRLCLDMNNQFYSSVGKHWSFVGGNKYLSGWQELYDRLRKHPNAYELDESQYDSSLFSRAMLGMIDIRWEMLSVSERTPENRLRLERLYESVVHTVICMEDGELWQKHTGNPSGSSNTIVDNTLILFRLFAYAWIIRVEEEFGDANRKIIADATAPLVQNRVYSEEGTFGGYLDFMSHVEAALNGDDNSFTVSDECNRWFNPDTIAPIWSSIGITTNTPNNAPGQKVEEITFLSQGFVKYRGLILPCPEFEKTRASLLYGADHDDVRWHLLRACALRIDTWGNIKTRLWLAQYIEYLRRNYKAELVGVFKHGDTELSMDNINGVYKTDDWIWRLYSGKEGAASAEDSNLSPLKDPIIEKILNNLL